MGDIGSLQGSGLRGDYANVEHWAPSHRYLALIATCTRDRLYSILYFLHDISFLLYYTTSYPNVERHLTDTWFAQYWLHPALLLTFTSELDFFFIEGPFQFKGKLCSLSMCSVDFNTLITAHCSLCDWRKLIFHWLHLVIWVSSNHLLFVRNFLL